LDSSNWFKFAGESFDERAAPPAGRPLRNIETLAHVAVTAADHLRIAIIGCGRLLRAGDFWPLLRSASCTDARVCLRADMRSR
jgi:hypothetical protein